MQINRLFEIIYILLNKKRVTATELSEYFGVSRQTICRDIDTLTLAGIPIYTERGKGGGMSLLPDFVLNKLILSEPEQNEILSALQGLSKIKQDDTDQILKKLSTVFNKTTTDWLEVDFVGWSDETNFFNDLKNAILHQCVVTFDYYNSEGSKSFRYVEPMQLYFKSNSWYLKAFCLSKQGLRLYKLSRIKNLKISEDHFEKRALVIAGNPMQENDSNENNEVIVLRVEPEMAYRVFDDFFDSETVKESNGCYIITVKWPENNWLTNFILSFGNYIEVLEPPHLRKTIQEEAQKISNKYL